MSHSKGFGLDGMARRAHQWSQSLADQVGPQTSAAARFTIEPSGQGLLIHIPGRVDRDVLGRLLLGLARWAAMIAVAVWMLGLLWRSRQEMWLALLGCALMLAYLTWTGIDPIRVLLQRTTGREMIRLDRQGVELVRRILWFEQHERFAWSQLRELNIAPLKTTAMFFSTQGKGMLPMDVAGRVRFVLPDRSLTVGLGLEPEQAGQILAAVRRYREQT